MKKTAMLITSWLPLVARRASPRALALLLLAATLLAPRLVRAEAVVLSVQGDTVLVDLGAADGVVAGTELQVLHVVTVKDPITKETLSDTFPLGTLTVLRTGEHVAEARAEEGLGKRVRVGDPVTVASATVAVRDPWQERVDESKRAPRPTTTAGAGGRKGTSAAARRTAAQREVDDDDAVREVWRATLGQPPLARIERWEALLAAAPHNRHADSILAEIASLRAQADALARAADVVPADRAVLRATALAALDARARGHLLAGAPPEHALGGRPVALAFLVLAPAATAHAWLYARAGGAGDYRRIALAPDGDGYLRGEIPAELVVAPGVEWFVEVGAARGDDPIAALGRRDAPLRIEVADAVEPPAALAGRSRVTMSADYVDFDGGLGKGWDQYQQAELDFMYRFVKPIYALRLGLGTLSGTGGPKDTIDNDLTGQCRNTGGARECRKLSFTYVYTEVELKLATNASLMLRPQIGRLTFDDRGDGAAGDCLEGEPDAACEITQGAGFRARLRLGQERGTNLLLGAAVTQRIGTLLEAAYSWTPRPEVPVLLAVQVTNMPFPEDFGVRIVGDVGWRRTSWVYPSLRLSYQARDVDHSGFSGGLGLNFDW